MAGTASAVQGFLISQVQGNNVVLFLLLVALFVVAYRVLRAVINTAIVAVLSGGFVVALDYIGIGPRVTLNRFMLFMVLGTALFIAYSALFTLLRTTSSLVGACRRIWRWITAPFGSDDGDESKEKEIVLDELQDE
ncbi:MAG: hypothetical protein SVW77_01705 [Candidatus Nanohaloarchaea archaeon]|nr:hypothetical protein [Candidatus Nanohaloarchaea archaeon]